MRLMTALLTALLLSSCTLLNSAPQPAPAPAAKTQEISRAQAGGLTRLGTISASVRGSPDDVQRALAAKANAAGASYYQILLVNETTIPGMWYGSAILFAPSAKGITP